MAERVLTIEDLRVSFDTYAGEVQAVRGVSLHVDAGEVLAIVGGANLAIGLMNSFSPSRLGWINLLCATLLMYALGRIQGKKEALERERLVHE